jgi:murein DD-endopeptidase MepM/ murein hydrolase activator NlpD
MHRSNPPRVRRVPRRLVAAAAAVVLVAVVAACGDDDDAGDDGWITRSPQPFPVETTEPPETSDSAPPSSDEPETTEPASSSPMSSSPMSSSPDSTSSTTTTTIDPADVAHAFPVDPEVSSSFTPQGHSNYQATDIFASAGCGTRLLAPVTGVVDEVLENTYDPAVDDPATRGGNAVSIIGDDGVRYYLAHFQLIDPAITPGARVTAGDLLGEMGDTGRAGACHVHFGLSLDCPEAPDDWWVRRGVIWPDEFLDSWRNGENLSPLPALQEWFTEYPDACTSIEGTPYPVS